MRIVCHVISKYCPKKRFVNDFFFIRILLFDAFLPPFLRVPLLLLVTVLVAPPDTFVSHNAELLDRVLISLAVEAVGKLEGEECVESIVA